MFCREFENFGLLDLERAVLGGGRLELDLSQVIEVVLENADGLVEVERFETEIQVNPRFDTLVQDGGSAGGEDKQPRKCFEDAKQHCQGKKSK